MFILDGISWLFNDGVFWVFAAATIFGAIAVVVSQSVARMAFWLIVSLGSTAGLFFALNADFVGATQLLIYVGGTVVLLIFGVMLTASSPFSSIKSSPGEGVMAGIIGVVLLSLIMYSAYQVDWVQFGDTAEFRGVVKEHNRQQGGTTRALGLAMLGTRPDRDLGAAGEKSLTSGYLLPFEIVSVHLLVVLVGAAYLARTKRRKDQSLPPG